MAEGKPKTKNKDEKKKMEEVKVVETPEKIILVDAVHCLVDEEGYVNKKLKNYLDSIKNKKIILTNATKDKNEQLFKEVKDYEVFTLENKPSKKDSEYYKTFLKEFNLIPEQVIYFEHDAENVKSAESIGIKTLHYKNNLEGVKKFIEENIRTEEEKVEKKKLVETKPKEKKTEAFVNMTSLPISTKHSIAVCKFIKGKKIENAIKDLEQVVVLKKAVPMKGEIPHRKGMMSGRYPRNASKQFIKLLNSLLGNANANGLENPKISEAIANLASRPYGKFGRVKRKRTHVKIVAKEIQNKEILKEAK